MVLNYVGLASRLFIYDDVRIGLTLAEALVESVFGIVLGCHWLILLQKSRKKKTSVDVCKAYRNEYNDGKTENMVEPSG